MYTRCRFKKRTLGVCFATSFRNPCKKNESSPISYYGLGSFSKELTSSEKPKSCALEEYPPTGIQDASSRGFKEKQF